MRLISLSTSQQQYCYTCSLLARDVVAATKKQDCQTGTVRIRYSFHGTCLVTLRQGAGAYKYCSRHATPMWHRQAARTQHRCRCSCCSLYAPRRSWPGCEYGWSKLLQGGLLQILSRTLGLRHTTSGVCTKAT
eukprot:355797-Chlamydomonas_euryale.AAC.4